MAFTEYGSGKHQRPRVKHDMYRLGSYYDSIRVMYILIVDYSEESSALLRIIIVMVVMWEKKKDVVLSMHILGCPREQS